MGRGGQRPQIMQTAKQVRRLHHDTGGIFVDQGTKILHHIRVSGAGIDLERNELGHRRGGLGIMGMQAATQQRLIPLGHPMGHQDRFGTGRSAVVHGCIGYFHAGQ